MGISRSPLELQGKLSALGAVMADLPKAQVESASLIVKTSVKALAPARLRGVGKRGAPLNVRYNSIGKAAEAQSLVYALGPWQLIERDTRPHQIPRARGGRGRQRYAVFGGNVYSRANHPGTRGKHPWQLGVEAARPAVAKVFADEAGFALRTIF